MLNRDRIGALLLLAFTLGYGALTFRIPLLPFQAHAAFTARTVPEALTLIGIGLCLILLIKPGRDPAESLAGYQWGRAGALCAVMLVYGLTVRPGGFLLSTGLFLIAGFLIMGERRWVLILDGISLSNQFIGIPRHRDAFDWPRIPHCPTRHVRRLALSGSNSPIINPGFAPGDPRRQSRPPVPAGILCRKNALAGACHWR